MPGLLLYMVFHGSLCLVFSAYTKTDQGLTLPPNDISNAETYIDLSSNAFVAVGATVYSQFTALQTLKLSNNLISSVDPAAFSGTVIAYLHLSNNRLLTLPDFRILNQTLTNIYLDSNVNLQDSPSDSQYLEGLSKVRFIELSKTSYNNLDAIKESIPGSITQLYLNTLGNLSDINTMGNFSNVFRLELASNRNLGKTLNSITFAGMGSLIELNIRELGLTSFPSEALLPVKNTLEKLFLDKNPITNISGSDLEPYINLKRLYINYASLSQFPDISSLNGTLEQLSLAGNNIEIIPDLALDGFEKITYVHLGDNPVSYLPDFGSANDNIEILNIYGLALTYLDRLNASRFTSLKEMYAGGTGQAFTDLSNFTVLNTLKTFSLDTGKVDYVSTEFVDNMPELTTFRMKATKLYCMEKVNPDRNFFKAIIKFVQNETSLFYLVVYILYSLQ